LRLRPSWMCTAPTARIRHFTRIDPNAGEKKEGF
jgi:hypothetical protein